MKSYYATGRRARLSRRDGAFVRRREGAALIALVAAAALSSCTSGKGPMPVASAAAVPIPVLGPPAPPPVPARIVPKAPAALVSNLAMLTANFQGKVGIAVHSMDEGWSTDSNGTQLLPQQSVSKLWVAMTVLDFRDAGRLKLDDPVTVRREDLTVFHQPIAALVKGEGYQTTVGELLTRAMTESDNTANDRLLQYVGGPDAVREFIARKKLGAIRFGPGERLLQSATAGLDWKDEYAFGNAFTRARARLPQETRQAAFERYVSDPQDGAAPAAIVQALARLKKGDLLSPGSTSYLISRMEQARTGRQRLRGAVPEGWTFGHKTGTGQDLGGRTAGYNDVGILTAPDGKSYAVAVMIGDTGKPVAERQALMQAVVAAIVVNHPGGIAPMAAAGQTAFGK